MMSECLKQLGKIEQAEKNLEDYIEKVKKQNMESAESIAHQSNQNQVLSKVYQNYVSICGENLIKSLYICRRWASDC